MIAPKNYLILLLSVMFAGTAVAQTDSEVAEQIRRSALQPQESAAQMHESQQPSPARAREVELQLREAERQLAEAARNIAELSSSQMPRVAGLEQRFYVDSGHPMLGVNIGSGDKDGPVEGAEVVGVSPGGAADDAGLRAGDVITAIDGETFSASSGDEANDKLLDFMAGVEAGDTLDVDYIRSGKVQSVQITPRPMSARGFAFAGPNFDMLHMQPGVRAFPPMPHTATLWVADGGWGDMEMVALTERLGSYFGTVDGLLVVRAPEDEALKLEDGDVIQSIGGRVPNSVSHAMRILGSYQSGEKLEIVIMRDRKKRTLSIEMPDRRTGDAANFTSPTAPVRVMRVPPAVRQKAPERT